MHDNEATSNQVDSTQEAEQRTNKNTDTRISEMHTENTNRDSNPNPAPSPSSPPQTSDVEDDNANEHAQMTDQIMELMRREALRHLEFAWEAERNLVLFCQDNDNDNNKK